jgi:hypothetical protein
MKEETKKWADATANGPASVLEGLLGNGAHRQSTTIDFPGWRGKPTDEGGFAARVTIWLLGFDELAAAENDALAFLREKLKMSESDIDRLEGVRDLEVKVQTLFRALRSTEQPTVPFARYTQSIRQLEPDTIQALYDSFIEFSVARSPFLAIKNPEELDEVVEYLGKGLMDETYLSRFDAPTLRRILRSLAVRLVKQASRSSSDSSSPSGSVQP